MSRRNYGYGRRLDYAGRQALRERYAGGHYGTQHTQGGRWTRFARWARAQGIRDMRDVEPAHVRAWAQERLEDGYAPHTVRNEVSGCNVVVRHASRGRWTALSPSAIAGPRDDVRRVAPATYDHETDQRARDALARSGQPRAAVAYGIIHSTGMRIREASLADLDRLNREAERYGQINIQEGSKGGRRAPRWVPVTERGRAALDAARAARPAGSSHLLRPDESYAQWRDGEQRRGRRALHDAGVRGYHDARAAYACHRYAQLTGHAAPVVAGVRSADKVADRAAREIIAVELGHGRAQVVASYVGSSR